MKTHDLAQWCEPFSDRISVNVDLSRLNTWKVGGRASYVFQPHTLSDVAEFFKFLPITQPFLWLGLGSNVLFPDAPIDKVVIMTHKGLRGLSCNDEGVLRAEAGVTCAKLARYASRLGYVQGAFFAGIPGTVGGAMVMNAGAFGGETWAHLTAVEVVDRAGNITICSADQFKVAYRHVQWPQGVVGLLAGHFTFPSGGDGLTIAQLLKQRGAAQPIGSFNCGSVFRNPPGHYAAALIEQSGLKGLAKGGAQISPKHANFIINHGHASAVDIMWLMQHIVDKVFEDHGIRLVPEVQVVSA